ncbi:MAG: TIGR04282 family arsenosugar biosynthesis glycosyltransferase [Hyphomicrobiales bacterium]|nr:TIGR04282 family arsenosugar biosynthesis glycosyltransferase [Rhodoblastus sp.]MCC2100581.1 TIGR04282 family arsenosugar biosynthesis glycosyltransferase [Hyphomicrobiales bacterium]MCO5086594.1 TIGR04282 family arsenosugar biosynthesis glycosyltransferase [Methylobacteriaceae bacterium]HRY02943.1 TIGR04282 family arsenosugar biosynthesis glycosyltransferase [Beijerinckiaceae bacterium]MCC2105461.1 TIGR04282 family arsenosugar biosynthesis glycosyltransferase [Hyphomicrobiales bacterium]
MSSEVSIALMARAPEPGRAKTRLIPSLGATGAARLHAAMTRHALSSIARCGLGATIWCEPGTDHPFFAECARDFGAILRGQSQGDLGARMHAIFACADGPLLLMGSDCPSVDVAMLRSCAEKLARADAVFLPTADGGYGLIGLQRPIPEIFLDMPWGTDAVMTTTRERLSRLRVDWVEPAQIWDVDTPDDLARLAATGFPIPACED